MDMYNKMKISWNASSKEKGNYRCGRVSVIVDGMRKRIDASNFGFSWFLICWLFCCIHEYSMVHRKGSYLSISAKIKEKARRTSTRNTWCCAVQVEMDEIGSCWNWW